MTALRTAAQQALEALEWCEPAGTVGRGGIEARKQAIAALRAALAQQDEPVQEPVAWLQPKTVDGYSRPDLGYETCSKDDYGAFPAYAAPPQRKPLTEEEIRRICDEHWSLRQLARAIERAHGIKERA